MSKDASSTITVLNVQSFKDQVFDFEKNKQWSYTGKTPMIVDFYADWCGPCRMLSPVLEEIANDYKGRVQVYKVDTEESPELASLFGVRGIPALLFIPMTGEPAMASGFMPKESLQQAIQEIFKINPS